MKSAGILRKAENLASRSSLPEPKAFLSLVEASRAILADEDKALRPRDDSGRPGGLLLLRPGIPTVLVPDIHARASLLSSLLNWNPPGMKASAAELLEKGELQVLCLGDAFHSEAAGARERWTDAYREYLGGFVKARAMNEEMSLIFDAVELVLLLKNLFPGHFHYLKGNHDNISDEEGGGNHSFGKFAYEGRMVALWTARFLGEEFLSEFYALEKEYPLLAKGENFLASHAEPSVAFSPSDLLEYRGRPDVVEGLTWTANGMAQGNSVARTLENFFGPEASSCLYFGGHRPVEGSYALRAGGAYVQIHNPFRFQVACLFPGRPPDPGRDIHLVR